ncbi:capsular biosynthesis protein [Bordetella avium]|uniref:capsular biosynthesis protein n=1 Tax=Bordetella avium TaxID=521 RepID=UPI000E0AD370|nr:capsular biosynthesis protein [Bordetella avium]RIQ13053.1 capsular biosynthesis protein [Bordetella avium]RIQ37619.1 capsular biosynthesis protein [Bordetella avium]RIQ42255.1 capsular biosynthesis protein [Bordetella avium]RIQ42702.1 capsular biosynthesis protein [Bordetella avium]RIQ49165.1 capsular biosynthesis protein [Bordetella avium]
MSRLIPRALTRAALALSLASTAVAAPPAADFVFEMHPAALTGAPDMAALNRPLDSAARIVARGGHFYRAGPDGQRVRFFGVNLTFGANFPDAQEARQLALQLRKLGFNAVRLHHLDSQPSDYPDAPVSILTSGPFPSFSSSAVQRLRGLIEALALEGIYVNLNLHVGYRFRPAVDDLPALDGGAQRPPITAPIHVYEPRLIEKQELYARELIQRLGLKDNPALAMVELNNESSLLAAWLGNDWRSAIPSAYAPALQRQWREWLLQHYGSLAQACAAWSGCVGGDDNAAELPEPGQQQVHDTAFGQLRAGLARRVGTWLGSAEGPQGNPRERDFMTFLVSVDRRYFDRLRRAVHESAGAQVPVTGTQMGYGGLLNFDSQSGMDYIDEHFYIGHPDIRSTHDWRIPARSASGNEFDRLLALSLRRDRARPFVVSEFSQPFPNPRGTEILPLMSAVAALQDWDGLFYFDYSDAQRLPQAPSRFALSGDWGRMALVGQSAKLFRQPLLAPLPVLIDIPVGPSLRRELGADRRFDAITHGLADSFGIKPQLALMGQVALLLAPPPQAAVPPADPAAATALLRQEPDRLLIDAPGVWALFGSTGKSRIGNDAVWIQFAPPELASVMLTPLDGLPISASRHLLLALGNPTMGSQPGATPPRPKTLVPYRGQSGWMTLNPDPGADGPSGDMATRAPAWLRRQPAELGLAPRGGRLIVYPLDGEGRRRAALPAAEVMQDAAGARIRVQQDTALSSPWYELVFEDKP